MKQNPFDIPGFSANQDNPLLASLNMMQQIWGNMAKTPLDLSSPTAMPSVEDLNKRIEELQAVESWLRLNLSMLSSTIQGLEIQRSTLSTLQSMAKTGFSAMSEFSETMSSDDSTTATSQADSNPDDETDESLRQAGQAWWDLLQNQFESIATATAQSMQQAQSVAENLSSGVGAPSADTTFSTKKAASKGAKKTAAKKTSVASKATKTTVTKASKKTAAKAAKKTS